MTKEKTMLFETVAKPGKEKFLKVGYLQIEDKGPYTWKQADKDWAELCSTYPSCYFSDTKAYKYFDKSKATTKHYVDCINFCVETYVEDVMKNIGYNRIKED